MLILKNMPSYIREEALKFQGLFVVLLDCKAGFHELQCLA